MEKSRCGCITIAQLIMILFKKILSCGAKSHIFPALVFFSILYPLLLALKTITEGGIPFWFDPARDFLLAVDNLKKPALIGPPSGIPGLFYGPYWIWFISISLLLSKDPRIVVALVLMIPYLLIFPYLLFRFTPLFGKTLCLLLWLLFILSYGTYATFLWNPHLAPLFFLCGIFLLIFTPFLAGGTNSAIRIFFSGVSFGLLMNVHISFGLGILIATLLFFPFQYVIAAFYQRKKLRHAFKNTLQAAVFFCVGFILTFTPFILFEYRHDFLQTTAVWKTILNAVMYNSASVGQTGLTNGEIIQQFFGILAVFLQVPSRVGYGIYYTFIGVVVGMIGYFLLKRLKKQKIEHDFFVFTEIEKSLLLYIFLCSSSILYLYLSSKNPVWIYHFLGVEILFMFFVGLVARKIVLVEKLLIVWVIIIVIRHGVSFGTSPPINAFSLDTLVTKKHIVETIYKDAGVQQFSVFSYSPAIYTYDYDYLFLWLGKDVYRHEPEKNLEQSRYVYLIIPKTSDAIREDFINYRTPNDRYATDKIWEIENGTVILKREKRI